MLTNSYFWIGFVAGVFGLVLLQVVVLAVLIGVIQRDESKLKE